MTQKQANYAKALKRQIHLSSRYIHYFKDDREAYEELLTKHFGVTSSTKLKIDELVMLRDYMNHETEELPIYEPEKATEPQLSLMRLIWSRYAQDVSDKALIAFINHNFTKKYVQPAEISLTDAQKIIPVLKKMDP